MLVTQSLSLRVVTVLLYITVENVYSFRILFNNFIGTNFLKVPFFLQPVLSYFFFNFLSVCLFFSPSISLCFFSRTVDTLLWTVFPCSYRVAVSMTHFVRSIVSLNISKQYNNGEQIITLCIIFFPVAKLFP